MNTQSVLVRPVITEKSMLEAESGKFTFVVAKAATKDDVKKAVQAVFNVTPVSVATSIVKGKRNRVGSAFFPATIVSWTFNPCGAKM